MRWLKKTVHGQNWKVLEVSLLDSEEEIKEIQEKHSNANAIQVSLSDMDCLRLFPDLELLILTGGMPSESGLQELYSMSQLKVLVLDYEETDTDEDGIVLERIPSLRFVLSRSNLNIYRYTTLSNQSYSVEIVNTYKNGRPLRIKAAPTTDICAFSPDFFFSIEAQSPAAVLLMTMLKSIEIESFDIRNYSSQLDSIAIIPICVSKEWRDLPQFRERRYVNLSKRSADIRIHMGYEEFLMASERERVVQCIQMISQSAEIIARKDKTFNSQRFMEDIRTAFC